MRYIHSWLTGQINHVSNATDLLGTPVRDQHHANKVDGIGRDSTLLTRQPSCRGKLVSLLRLIGLPSTIDESSTDSRWMNPELFGNAGL